MLLNSLIKSLKNTLSLIIIGQFPEKATVKCFRQYDRYTANDNCLYLLGESTPKPDFSLIEQAKGYYILYNPSTPVTAKQCITVYSDISEAHFFNTVLDIFEQEYEISSYFHSIYTLAIRSKNPGELLNDLQTIFHNELFLFSSSFYIVESTLDSLADISYFWKQNDQYLLSPATIEHIKESGLLARALHASNAILIEDPFWECPLVLANIKIDTYVTGYFVIAQTNQIFTEKELAMASFLAEVMGQLIYSNTTHLTEQYFNDEYFLQTLLSPTGYNVHELADIMQWNKYLNCNYYQFLICSTSGDFQKKTATHLYEQLRHLFPTNPILTEQNTVTVFFFGNKKLLLTETTHKALTELLSLQKQLGIMSFCFSDLTQASSYHRHTLSLLKHFIHANDRRNNLLLMDDNYFQMIMQALKDGQLDQSMIHPDILFLKQYDLTHNSELTLTLATYLACNRNVAVMAQQLHINKSTGFYRINQIKELLDNPLDSSEKLFFYECALHIFSNELPIV